MTLIWQESTLHISGAVIYLFGKALLLEQGSKRQGGAVMPYVLFQIKSSSYELDLTAGGSANESYASRLTSGWNLQYFIILTK